MKHKVVVVGAGQWGRNVVRTIYELGALAGVAEADPGLREGLTVAYPDVPLFDDYREAIANTDAAGIAVATPAHTHHEIAGYALNAGKDVLVEKPMTLSTGDAERLIDSASRNRRILMVGHLLLYQPGIRRMKELMDSGAIGELKALHQERMKLGRVRSVENVLWSFGVHDIAVFLYVTGRTPSHVEINGQSIIQPGIEDDVYLHLSFHNGVAAHLHASWLWPETRRRLTAVGTQGMIVFDEERQTVTLHRKGVNSDLSNRDDGYEIVLEDGEPPLRRECQHFLECMATRAQPVSDGQSGLDVVKVLEQATAGLRRKKGTSFDG